MQVVGYDTNEDDFNRKKLSGVAKTIHSISVLDTPINKVMKGNL